VEREIWVNESVGVSDYVHLPGWLRIFRWEYVALSSTSGNPDCIYLDSQADCVRVRLSSLKISKYDSITISESKQGYVIRPVRPFAFESISITEHLEQGALASGFLTGLRRLEMEEVFLGHNNYSALILTVSGNPIGTSMFTKMELQIGDVLVSSLNGANASIRWNQVGYQLGEVRFYLGAEALEPGIFNAPFILYSTIHPNGIVWDKVRFLVYSEVEAQPLGASIPVDGLSVTEYIRVSIN